MKKGLILTAIIVMTVIVTACSLFYVDTSSIIATQVALAIENKIDELELDAELSDTDNMIEVATPYPTYTPYPTPSPHTFTTYGNSYVIGTPGGCLNAIFISENIPDNTVFEPGDGFIKTWTIKNTGYCTWNSNYHLVLESGDAMGGDTYVSLGDDVSPGQSIEISANLTAPNSAGTYRGEWRVQSDLGINFARFWVQIVVR